MMSLTRASDAARFASVFADMRLVAARTYVYNTRAAIDHYIMLNADSKCYHVLYYTFTGQ